MSFILFASQLQKAQKESAAWQLLRSNNVHFVLAFINDVFKDNQEIDYEQAKFMLGNFMEQARQDLGWDTDKNAGSYLNEWTKAGWLRETDNKLIMTDASYTALNFAKQLNDRTATTTSSRLLLVQDYARNLSFELSEDNTKRRAHLLKEKANIERQLKAIESGVESHLDEDTLKERINDMYSLAASLPNDFRSVEEGYRQSHRDLRHKMIGGNSLGDVLEFSFEHEEKLLKTESGKVFDNFCAVLMDDISSTELRENIQFILAHPISDFLSATKQQTLAQLVRTLNKSAEQVLKTRRKVTNDLSSFVQSGSVQEVRLIDKLIQSLEQKSLQLIESEINLKTATTLKLTHGAFAFKSPANIKLKEANDDIEIGSLDVAASTKSVEEILSSIKIFSLGPIAQNMKNVLQKHGQMSLGRISEFMPTNLGAKGLTAYIRIANIVGACEDLTQRDELVFYDQQGQAFLADVPMFILNAEMFTDEKLQRLSF